MIGIDIEKIDRFKFWSENEFKRIFTDAEIEYAMSFGNNIERFCGFFCVKEAFVKALDNDGIGFKEIEILHTDTGKPYINRTPYINAVLKEHFLNRIDVSISHTSEYAAAVVLVE